MRFILKYLCSVIAIASLAAHDVYIPEEFHDNRIIEQVILIMDVDGVVRESIRAVADPRVISAVKTLLENKNVDVTFISGTPIDNDASLEAWRRGNLPLNRVFGSHFQTELAENRVAIYGVLGGHRMTQDGGLEIVDEYSLETSFELAHHLLQVFLMEVQQHGDAFQKKLAKDLESKLHTITLQDVNQPTNVTAREFSSIVRVIREHFDPDFRVINNGALVETHTSNPPWSTGLFVSWMQEKLDQPHPVFSHLRPEQKWIAAGHAKCGDQPINYFLISKTNKGLTTKKHIEEKLKKFPNALIVTIGDTQVDFPMHRNAHVAFHVGLEKAWYHEQPVLQCMMVRSEKGEDSQHIAGTLKVLELINDAIGKPFYEFKYFPMPDSSGRWDFYCLNEIGLD
jgi:hypothetical protein